MADRGTAFLAAAAGSSAAETWRERFATTAERAGTSLALGRSCVLALGTLCRPWQDASSPDAPYGERLRTLARTARDLHTRYYAWFAMGLAGGRQHREFLLEQFANAKFLDLPWVAFGLAAWSTGNGEGREALVNTVEAKLAGSRNPNVREALVAVVRVLRREQPEDADVFRERYRAPLPGGGNAAARLGELTATLANDKAPIPARCVAAVAIGHLADLAPRHWSTKLARSIDYRSATPALLALPNGVLRLP